MNKLRNVKSFIAENDTFTPLDNADAYDNQRVTSTGGGRVSNYTTSNSSYRWLISNATSDSFLSGYLEDSSLIELERLFLGTDRSAEVVFNLNTAKLQAKAESDLAQQEEIDYYNNVWSPGISAAISAANAAIAAGDPGAYYSALADIEDLDNGLAARQFITNSKTSIYILAIRNHGSYIANGKINTPDPYQLDDPTVAAALEKKRQEEQKRNQQIDKELEKLKQDNERLKTESGFRAFQTILNLGFDLATAIAVLNFLSGPADEAALIAGKLSVQEILERMAQKGGAKAASEVAKDAISSSLDDAAAATISKLAGKDGGGRLISKIYDALESGSKEAVEKALNAADDFLYGGPLSGSSRAVKYVENSYGPQGIVLSENKKRILREIKKPYKLPEIPKKKYKMNFSGKYAPQNTPDKTASKLTDELVASGNAKGQRWRLKDKEWQGYETTERMNIIYDRVGHGNQYWNMVVNENKNKKGWRDIKIQEQLNIIAHEKAMLKENPNYQSPFGERIEEEDYYKDSLFKKVSSRIKKEIDYPEKPSKNGFPDQPPPKMINGYHPDFGKRKDYYKRLDTQSAKAMPATGDPEIDAQVKAARKRPK